MKKIIKRYGGSVIISLSAEELKIYKLKIGDVIEIGDLVKVKKEEETNINNKEVKSKIKIEGKVKNG